MKNLKPLFIHLFTLFFMMGYILIPHEGDMVSHFSGNAPSAEQHHILTTQGASSALALLWENQSLEQLSPFPPFPEAHLHWEHPDNYEHRPAHSSPPSVPVQRIPHQIFASPLAPRAPPLSISTPHGNNHFTALRSHIILLI